VKKQDEAWEAVRDAVLYYSTKWKAKILLLEKSTDPITYVPESTPTEFGLIIGWATLAATCRFSAGTQARTIEVNDEVAAVVYQAHGTYCLRMLKERVTGPEDVDKIFKYLEKTHPKADAFNEASLRMKSYQQFRSVMLQRWKTLMTSKRTEISTIEDNLASLWRQYLSLNFLLQQGTNAPEDQLKHEASLIYALGMPTFDYEGSVQMTIITKPITVHDIGNGKKWVFGQYRVDFDMEDLSISIYNHDVCWPEGDSDGFWHPHINQDGNPCWGNSGAKVRELLASGKIGECCVLIREFLESYNPPGAYRHIGDDDGDDDSEDHYEGCFENASNFDCVGCTDESCPYQEEACGRCHENHDRLDCIACGHGSNCDHHETEIEECKGEHAENANPWECARCGVYNGNCELKMTFGDCAALGKCGECPEHCEHFHEKEDDDE
jgi:hypothetical protein